MIQTKCLYYWKDGAFYQRKGPLYNWLNVVGFKFHRLDGPAIEYESGRPEFYIYGTGYCSDRYTEAEKYKQYLMKINYLRFIYDA